MKWVRSSAFVGTLVVTGLWLSTPAALAQDVVSASASLTDLQIHLIDLDPDDGITPWITFTSPMGSNGHLVAYGISEFQYDPVLAQAGCCNTYPSAVSAVPGEGVTGPGPDALSSTPLSVWSLDGTSAAAANGSAIATSARLSNEDMATHRQMGNDGAFTDLPLDWWVSTGGYATAGSGPFHASNSTQAPWEYVGDPESGHSFNGYRLAPTADLAGLNRFDLSPRTKVIFTGSLSAQADANPDQLEGVLPDLAGVRAMAGAHVTVSTMLPSDGQTFWVNELSLNEAFQYQSAAAGAFANSRYLDGWAMRIDQTEAILHEANSSSFDFHVVNDSPAPSQGIFYAYISTSVTAEALTAAVPEAQSWALFVLGLAGISLAARRRQAPQS